jgi:Leu/Phe-tRNA-protein transferase
MFSKAPNASKFAFITLARQLLKMEFLMLDCQVPSGHLKTLGGPGDSTEKIPGAFKTGIAIKDPGGKMGILKRL